MHFRRTPGANYGPQNREFMDKDEQTADVNEAVSVDDHSIVGNSSQFDDPISSFWHNLDQLGEASPRIAEEFQKALDEASNPTVNSQAAFDPTEPVPSNRLHGRGFDHGSVDKVREFTEGNSARSDLKQDQFLRSQSLQNQSPLGEPDWDDHLSVSAEVANEPLDFDRRSNLIGQHDFQSSFAAEQDDLPLHSFAEGEKRRGRSRLPIAWKTYRVPVFVAMACVAFLTAASYAAIEFSKPVTVAQAAVPLIKVSEVAERSRPEVAGGIKVPDQDKLVLNGLDAAPLEDKLVPAPELPTAVTASSANWAVSEGTLSIENLAADRVSFDGSRPIIIDETVVQEAPALLGLYNGGTKVYDPAAVDPVRLNEPVVQLVQLDTGTLSDAPAVPSTPQAPALLPNQVLGPFGIQTASFRKPESAKAEWKRMQRKHPELLGDMVLRVQRVEISSGVWFRLQAGPIPNKITAQDLCSQLLKRGEKYCIPVKK